MPDERDDTVSLVECDCIINSGTHGASLYSGKIVIHQVKARNAWGFADVLLNPCDGGELLLAREDHLAIVAKEV